MLIDSHCHLDFPEFSADMPATLAAARSAGVGRLITISTRIDRYDVYRGIAEANDSVWFSIGTHPHRAHEELEATVAELARMASHPKCVAIGEAGLDYHYDKAPRDKAAEVFRAHIEAARRTGLPLVIHSRDADDDMAAILRDEMQKGPFKALLHCFTSSRALAQTGLELGLYISFSGVLTFRRPTNCAPSPRISRSTGCWSKPMRVPGPGSLSRQAQPAGLCRGDRESAGWRQGRERGGGCRRHHSECAAAVL